MNKEEYLNKRKSLLDEAQLLIDKGDLKLFDNKKIEIEQLDDDFEAQATAAANLASEIGNKKIPEIIQNSTKEQLKMTDKFNSNEYRTAFMNYVTKGVVPTELKNETTKTSDINVVIPTVVLDRIIEKMEDIGKLLTLVTRTSYKGGLTIPTSDVKPVATWVAEGTTSEKQKLSTGSITFAYHKLRCAMSMTLEVETMALSAFENKFINDVSNAMTRALESAIVNGDGNGKPTGILNTDSEVISVASEQLISYNTLIEMESALPAAYESGTKYFMTKRTFMKFYGMTDENGQPISRVNYGLNGKIERTLLGREVETLDEYMKDFSSSATSGTIVAFLFNPADYILNTNLNVTVKSYEDNDTEDKVTKAVMIVDGKVIDKNSLIKLAIE